MAQLHAYCKLGLMMRSERNIGGVEYGGRWKENAIKFVKSFYAVYSVNCSSVWLYNL